MYNCSKERKREEGKRWFESMKTESRRLGCTEKTREEREMMQKKIKKNGRNGVKQMEKWGREEVTTEREARGERSRRGEMMMRKKRRRTNRGPLRGSKMFFVPVSLTKDQDLCDTSLLNLENDILSVSVFIGRTLVHTFCGTSTWR